jgi:hypothetical protein
VAMFAGEGFGVRYLAGASSVVGGVWGTSTQHQAVWADFAVECSSMRRNASIPNSIDFGFDRPHSVRRLFSSLLPIDYLMFCH